ncbi:glutamate---cysteine ligase / carboxylate-amine ligase [Marmoricola sp. URHA0025 HA25]
MLFPSSVARPALTGSAFAPGGEFTVGAEEELLLVDADHRLRRTPARDLVERLTTDCAEFGTVTTELYAAEIEFATEVCDDAACVAACLGASRACLRAAGGLALAVGVHPDGPFGDAQLTDGDRYRAIGESFAGLLRTPTASLQVHVGLPDPAAAIAAYRGLRHHLAVLNALAAGSPFWHGRDSGLASARWAVINSYPRGGVPPAVRSWEEYVDLAEAVVAAADVPDYTHVWWDVRVQPRYGTVEVRVMDAQPSLGAAAGLAALVQGIARHAVEQPTPVDVPGAVLAENDFRVARHGLETSIVGVDGSRRAVRDLARGLVARARAVLDEGQTAALDGVDRLLVEEPAYVRQRRIHDEGGMAALLADLSTRTARG